MAQHRQEDPHDPFDAALNVESTFHNRGYSQGLADGNRAGLVEGRAFGYQKGFEKWLEAGRLASKSIVWANRLPGKASTSSALPALPNNARLEKNIGALYGLVNAQMLSMENSDASVQDFDDRLKRAEGKVRIIERVVNPSREGSKE